MLSRRSILAGAAVPGMSLQVRPVLIRPEVITAFREPLDREMIGWLNLKSADRVLDAGCGRGDHVRLFAEKCKVVGVDLRDEVLEYARTHIRNSNAEFRKADIGFREPALEARADLAFTTHLAKDRIERGRFPSLWGQILRDAGLRDVKAHSFLHEANTPFTPVQEEYFRYHLARKAEGEVSEADKATLKEISDPASSRYILKRPDLYYVSVSTQAVATFLRGQRRGIGGRRLHLGRE